MLNSGTRAPPQPYLVGLTLPTSHVARRVAPARYTGQAEVVVTREFWLLNASNTFNCLATVSFLARMSQVTRLFLLCGATKVLYC